MSHPSSTNTWSIFLRLCFKNVTPMVWCVQYSNISMVLDRNTWFFSLVAMSFGTCYWHKREDHPDECTTVPPSQLQCFGSIQQELSRSVRAWCLRGALGCQIYFHRCYHFGSFSMIAFEFCIVFYILYNQGMFATWQCRAFAISMSCRPPQLAILRFSGRGLQGVSKMATTFNANVLGNLQSVEWFGICRPWCVTPALWKLLWLSLKGAIRMLFGTLLCAKSRRHFSDCWQLACLLSGSSGRSTSGLLLTGGGGLKSLIVSVLHICADFQVDRWNVNCRHLVVGSWTVASLDMSGNQFSRVQGANSVDVWEDVPWTKNKLYMIWSCYSFAKLHQLCAWMEFESCFLAHIVRITLEAKQVLGTVWNFPFNMPRCQERHTKW